MEYNKYNFRIHVYNYIVIVFKDENNYRFIRKYHGKFSILKTNIEIPKYHNWKLYK